MQQPISPQQEAIRRQLLENMEKGQTEPRADPIRQLKNGEKWQCHACRRDTFGIVEEGELRVKYRERDMTFSASEGRVEVRCRACQTLNVLNMANVNVRIEQEMPPDATDAAIDLAKQEGIDLFLVEGTGKDDKITVGDVRKIVEERDAELAAKVVSTKEFGPEVRQDAGHPVAGVQNQPEVEAVPTEGEDEWIEIDSE